MAIEATVIPILIASPSDVPKFRNVARDVLHEWNYIHTNTRRLVLMPVGWETHSSPELGSTAQDLINDRLLRDCDALIGIFWTRLGTPTAAAPSGSAEEIRRHVEEGKPALLYFCDQPVAPSTLDHKQYSALTEFRRWCEPQGLVESFIDEREFREKLRRQLQIALNDNPLLRNIIDTAQATANATKAPSALARYPTPTAARSVASRTGVPARTQRTEGDDAEFMPLGTEDLALPDLEPVTMSENGTKLDLARAYMDMGDPEGARGILQEVAVDGSRAQRKVAERLIKSLPGQR